MKLSSDKVERALTQVEALAIPEDHPALPQLNQLFGDHTFFLGASGLLIVEPTESSDAASQTGQVVKLASWNDESRTSLVPHEPEPTDMTVVLEAA